MIQPSNHRSYTLEILCIFTFKPKILADIDLVFMESYVIFVHM